MPKKEAKRRGGLTKGPAIDYNILTERAAPKGRFRVIVNHPENGFLNIGDFDKLATAKASADSYIEGLFVLGVNGAVAYVHNESNRVLFRTEV